MFRILICLIIINWSMPSMAQKIWNTYPQPPKPGKWDPMRTFPGIEVPEKPHRWTWQTTLKFNGEDFGYTNIRVFLFDGKKRFKVGDIPAGTKVELNEVYKGGINLYYSIPYVYNKEGANSKDQYAWIQGAHIEPTAFNADAK